MPGCSSVLTVFASALLGLCVAGPAAADDPAGAGRPAGKFAAQAAAARDRAAYVRGYTGDIIAAVAAYDDIVKDDIPLVQKAADVEAALEEQEAAAWDAGDQVTAERLHTKADQAARDNESWRRRLSDWRRRQGEAMPTEAQAQSTLSWIRPGTEAEFAAEIRAKRAAAAAWGRVAEAESPGADPAKLAEAQDQAMAADAEAEIAAERYQWAQRRIDILYNKPPETPEIRQALDDMRRLEEQRAQVRRAAADAERRARAVERELHAAEARLRKAADAAREQHERELKEQRERKEQRAAAAAGKK